MARMNPEKATERATLVSESELRSWGVSLGQRLQPPRVLALCGDLGAGKTTLVAAICEGYGVQTPTSSPTFALIHRYEAARSPVWHVDLYRTTSESEVEALGLDELLVDHAIVMVEWPERAPNIVPHNCLRIELQHVAGNPLSRLLQVSE